MDYNEEEQRKRGMGSEQGDTTNQTETDTSHGAGQKSGQDMDDEMTEDEF